MAVDKNSQKIEEMFDKIAPNYDFLNNVISFFTHKFVKKSAISALKIKKGAKILDLCSGSGDLGMIIFKKDKTAQIFGVDISEKMIEIAKRKTKNIKYFKASALNLPFENESFDYIVCAFGYRNIIDKKKCLSEIYRVLKPEGKFLHLDFGDKNFITKIYDFILKIIIKFLKNKEAYNYLINSKNDFKNPNELLKDFNEAGFKKEIVKYFFFKNISFQIVKK